MKGKILTYFLMFEINQISFPSIVIHETKFTKHMTHSNIFTLVEKWGFSSSVKNIESLIPHKF
jgi:hypothetical protein